MQVKNERQEEINEAEQKAADPATATEFEVYDVDWEDDEELLYLEDIQSYIGGYSS